MARNAAADAPSAAEFLPEHRDLKSLREAARGCRGCPLYENATQTVFGVGPVRAKLLLVGEQPGDREDLEGKPFVGPAGALLDRCHGEAGIARGQVYVTNAVKHFKWEPRGKRRIHKKPSAREVAACRPWVDAEIEAVRPALIVCLGATAAQSLPGPKFRVTQDRGRVMEVADKPPVLATIHPSAVLRAPDGETREVERARFVLDLHEASRYLAAFR